MKVISISMDRKLFEEGSAVLARQIEYAKKMEELHIVVFATKKHLCHKKSIGNLHIYPTDSRSRFLYIFDAFRIGRKIASNSKNVVISSQDPFETGLAGFLVHLKSGFPLFLQIHTDFLSAYFKNSFLNYIRLAIAKVIIPLAQGVRVVSENIAHSLKNKFPNLKYDLEVLPVFIDVPKIIGRKISKNIKTDFSQFDFIIFMASRLSKEKRIDVALQAFRKIVHTYPHMGLVIAGSGPEKNRLESLVKELGLSQNVVFMGWNNDLIPYYQTAGVFLLTSEYEGYGMTLVEAGASGCPIVTTKVGIAQTDLFRNGENSFVCPVGDVDCITASIAELISDKEKRCLFKQRMQDTIKSTTISQEMYVNKYVGLLEKLLKND